MIRVRKSRQPPKVLRTRGRIARQQLCRSHAGGQRQFKFDLSIYAHDTVKIALRTAQYDKCCFCEAKITHIQYGDVEHYRPKACFRQRASHPLSEAGYYWLAYDWRNLFLCCQLCNQRHKRNLFPLDDPAKRALDHTQPVGREKPLFINPVTDDPGRYIGFHDEIAYAIGNNRRGRTTIKALQLNRVELQERRRDWLAVLKLLKQNRDLLAKLIEKTPAGTARDELRYQLEEDDAELRRNQQAPAEYAAMTRALFNR